MRTIVMIVAAALTVSGCTAPAGRSKVADRPSAANNGRSIFLTGRDSAGRKISAARPPLRESCAACHGANGAGGVHLPGGAVSADLRHRALVTLQKHPYSQAVLERTIALGRDNEGKELDPVMPRWKMSRRDLHDVAAYVMTLK